MAEPIQTHHDHYVERDTGSGAGVWAIVAIIVVALALLLFGSNLFGGGANNETNDGTSDINIRGNIDTGGTGGAQ
jgi:hypothetical protein